MDIQGKVVVVTGASMGIGEAVARVFAEHGANVVMSSRDQARIEAARQRIGRLEQTTAITCDVRDRAQLESLLNTTLSCFGRVDVWVNNAGFGLVDSVQYMDMAACRQMFETNLFAPVEAMQQVISVMRRQGAGCIINISSVSGFIAVPYMSAYGATKHALNCFSRGVRAELEGTGVHVLNVCPGFVQTEFSRNAVRGTEKKKLGGGGKRGVTAEYIANSTLRAYKSGRREIVVPWYYNPVIWLYRAMPRMFENFMRAKMKTMD